MKKSIKFLSAIFAVALILVLAACGDGNDPDPAPPVDNQQPPVTGDNNNAGDDTGTAETGLPAGVYVDANGNYRFETTRNITVPLWDRDNSRIPDFVDSFWAEWIAEQMLAIHNVAVEWVTIPRWSEGEHISMLLGAGDAPDVSMSFSSPIVDSFASMGAIHNLVPFLDQYRDLLPNLYGFLGEDIVYWNLDPGTNELFSLMGREAMHGRVSMFVREDWLAALGLPVPTTHQEFENTLVAFRDRVSELPGYPEVVNAQNIIPLGIGNDVLWGIQPLIESFIPTDITERDWFIYGWHDRRFMHQDAVYQALELLNRWWDMDLMWDDLGVGESSDLSDQNRLGRVGVWGANWDMPFRPGDRYILDLRENVGPDANYIAFNPFPADNGRPQIFLANEAMRPIFFPTSNTEVLASFLYLDFMSRTETLQMLQLGVEGIHWEFDAAGAFVFVPNQDEDGNYNWEDRYVMPSGRNFDITITANGIGEDLLFYSYPGIEPAAVAAARDVATRYGRTWPAVSVRGRDAEEGMAVLRGGAAESISRQIAVRLVQVNPANFSERFAAEWADYMNMGGRAIIEERAEAWIESIGDCDFQDLCN